MKNIIFAFAFLLALPVFAADSVSIDSITQKPGQSATISGLSTYDTTGTTTITLSTGATRENYGTSWSYTFPLKTGRYTATAVNGNSVVKEFVVASNEGGLICPANQPKCGMPMDFQALMASQAPTEKPVVITTEAQMKEQLGILIKQVIALLILRVQELQNLLATQTVH